MQPPAWSVHGSQTGKQKNIKIFFKMTCIFRRDRLDFIHTKQLGKSGTVMQLIFDTLLRTGWRNGRMCCEIF